MAMHMDGTADAAGAVDVAHVSEGGSGDPADGTATGPAASERPRRRPGRPTGRPPDGEPETREQVLRHARRLFMQRGYAGVSVGEVAAAVGVTKPTLYYHFGDKEGLYAEVLRDLMREVGGYVRAVVEADRPLRERFVELAYGYFLYADATMEPLLRDTSELIGPERAAQVWEAYEREMFAPMRRLVAEAMERGELRPGDADTFVRAFLGMLDGLTAPGGHAERTEAEHRRVAEALVAIFLDGVRARG
jgi:AcrR family transcriptional regulator